MNRRTKLRPALLAPALVAAATFAVPAAPLRGQLLEGLSVHGFMTQAYGRTDGDQLIGLDSLGTADYRVAAIQFRYALDARGAFVLQLSHERLGRSQLNDLEPAVDLDWVFYEHRFDDYTVGRIGKVRSPIGIYNEIRDVGTLLPLYRPPLTLYGEKAYTSETIDGVTLGRRIPLGAWELSIDAFFGSWEFVQLDLETMAQIDGGYGAQVWLQTPLDGLRVGGAAVRYGVQNVVGAPPGTVDDQMLFFASLDGRFGRLGVRSEFFHVNFGEDAMGYNGTAEGYYGELTFDVTDQLTLVGEAQWSDFAIDIPAFMISWDENWDRAFTAAVRYAFTPNLVAKLEGGRYRGYSIENRMLLPGLNERANVNYALVSLSTSF